MNFREFVKAFTIHELNELSNAIYEVKRKWARDTAQPLTLEEKLIADTKPIEAIKAYRLRLGTSLLEAKVVVDVYKATWP